MRDHIQNIFAMCTNKVDRRNVGDILPAVLLKPSSSIIFLRILPIVLVHVIKGTTQSGLCIEMNSSLVSFLFNALLWDYSYHRVFLISDNNTNKIKQRGKTLIVHKHIRILFKLAI